MLSKFKKIFPLLLIIMSLIGCMSTRPIISQGLAEPNANVILYVSNQSFYMPTVDIIVKIDDRIVVEDEFEVRNQHHWTEYAIYLSPGEHTLHATALDSTVEIKRSFKVTGNHWVTVDFWRSKHSKDKSKGLKFDISDRPIGFI